MFDVNASLIRHWESKFDCIRPHKNKKGNRMFSPEDVEKLKQIYHLVKERGMTLDGANKVMKSSRKELSRETELLERLQRIRSALVEVREELKAGEGVQIVESAVAGDVEEPSEIAVETIADSVAAEESVAESSGGVEQPVITTIFLLIKISSFYCGIDFSRTRYYYHNKNTTKSKYAHLSAILT